MTEKVSEYVAPFTAISLFTGYDGIGLGLKRVVPSLRTLCYVEIEAYSAANVVSKIQEGLLDDAPVWSDIKTFDCRPWAGKVDLIHGGYPCPGFSAAGQRKGQADPRFLWPWVLRAVAVIQPRYCFFENVEGHVTLGLSTVISDLEEAGYKVEAGIFSAAECGAPQRRKRVFIMAYNQSQRRRETAEGRWQGLTMPESCGYGELAISESNGERPVSAGPRNEGQRASEPDGTISRLADSKRAERRTQGGADDANRQETGRDESASGFGECGESMANTEHQSGGTEQRTSEGQRQDRQPDEIAMSGGSGEVGPYNLADPASRQLSGQQSTGPNGIGSRSPQLADSQSSTTGDLRSRNEAAQSGPSDNGGDGELADAPCVGEREPHDPQRAEPRQDSRQDSGGGSGVGQADAECSRREGSQRSGAHDERSAAPGTALQCSRPWHWPGFVARPGEAQHEWEPRRVIKTERGLGGGVNGRAANLDRLRLLGNGVYPATAAKAFVTLYRAIYQQIK